MTRSVLLGVVALTLMTLVIGCAPNNIARSRCESTVLAIGDPWSCTVTGEIVGQASWIEFDTESRNRVAHVSIALRVTKGTLRLGYRDLAGDQHVLVTPSAPAEITMKTRMHSEDRSFTLYFEPVNGVVEGLSGTVKYSTP
jgi:hypothetical protein